MARIIYVEDEPAWLDLTRIALVGHQVDSASSFREAVRLIRENEPYHLALIDLNLEDGDDRLGAEILDLLRMEYPSTRRIVVTGRPPVGGLRANIIERYGVEEVIIKGRTTLPDLRKIVTEVLGPDFPVAMAQDVAIAKSDLMQRYRDWHISAERIIRLKIHDAENEARPPRKRTGEPVPSANSEINRLFLLREEFTQQCADFEQALSGATALGDVNAVSEQLDRIADRFAQGIDVS